jgi:thiosulfate dehydrogenase
MRAIVWFGLGVVVAVAVLVAGGYLFVRGGGVSLDTTAPPLPLERSLAEMALTASMGNAGAQPNPLPVNDTNLLAGAHVYQDHCALCHGRPGGQPSAIARGMFPDPPQLFAPTGMMTDDPQGETFWKVTHGIRLSGMPAFGRTLSDTVRWQLAMLIAHADKLPPPVQAALAGQGM